MQGVEMGHCNAAIEAIIAAYYGFLSSTAAEGLRIISAYGKSDTLGMDAMPEITIIEHLKRFDKYAVVITEETGSQKYAHFSGEDDPRKFRTIFISDPTDRSAQIKKLLESVADKSQRIGDIVKKKYTKSQWVKQFGGPAEITGGSSAITCIRRGVPLFAVMVNYITQQFFLSCSAGNYVYSLPEKKPVLTVDFIRSHGKRLYFRGLDSNRSAEAQRFVTFMGKTGYRENLVASKLMDDEEIGKYLHYDLPGGPLRVLYLSTLQPANKQIGFILSNGEKIGEWIHWLPFIRFARKEDDQGEPALRLFEVYQDRPYTRDGILMSTPPAYSIFKPVRENDSKMVIDVSKFGSFSNPSTVRATLIATPFDNDWATRIVNQYGYRAIELFEE